MIWLVVLGLALWIWRQQAEIRELGGQISRLKLEVFTLSRGEGQGQTLVAKPAPDQAQPPVQQDEPVAQAGGPLEAPPTPAPLVAPPRAPEPPRLAPPLASQARALSPKARSATDWLSEHGLAWLGGGVFALGGLLLVGYAAQRGLFTPALRVVAAVLLGFAALGAGEFLRRRPMAEGDNTRLVAALTTAAGAATLYAAIWAAHGLYGFIPAVPAAALLIAVSLGLLALAFLHGEALGLLAVAGAYAVPLVTDPGAWAELVDAYVLLILTTGLGAAALRDWGRTGMLTLVGCAVWILDRLFVSDRMGGGLLVCAMPILALTAAIAGARRNGPRDDLPSRLPDVAVAGASLFAILLWWAHDQGRPDLAGLSVALSCAVTAVVLRFRQGPSRLLAAPAAATVLCAALLRSDVALATEPRSLWLVVMLAALAGAAFSGARPSRGGVSTTAIGVGGVALALTLADPALAAAIPGQRALLEFAVAAALALGAAMLGRRAETPESDLRVAAWVGAGAETLGLALHAVVPVELWPVGYALLGAALAALAFRLRWRGLAEAAAIAALASLAALLTPQLAGAALRGTGDPVMIGAVAVAAAAIQGIAWRILRRGEAAPGITEATSTLAVLSGLLGAVLVLRAWTMSHGATMSPFAEASLRTLLLLAAGLALSAAGSERPLGRWRGPVLLGIGLAHGLLLQGLVLHPWWGGAARAVSGPPVVDELLLGLLAPGLILGWAAHRMRNHRPILARVAFAAGLGFVTLWIVTELRRLFHSHVLAGGFAYAEVAAYGAAALGLAAGLRAGRARLVGTVGGAEVQAQLLDLSSWVALLVGGVLLCVFASPWWGPLQGDLDAPVVLALGYGLGVVFTVQIAWQAKGSSALASAAWASAAIQLFVAVSLAVRYGFHAGAMRAPLREAGLETWAFSAIWALFGLAVLATGARMANRALRWVGLAILLLTTAKVFLFDMAHLAGAIRAGSFLALGAILLAGALTTRHLAKATGSEAA